MNTLLKQLAPYVQNPPDERMFSLWRAVFSLAHVDGSLAAEEMGFVNHTMDVFNFSEQQRSTVYADMVAQGKPLEQFQAIKDAAYKHQFFRLARILIWCDGLLHDSEMAMIERIKKKLGSDLEDYEAELRWMDRKPDMPLGVEAQNDSEEMMIMIMYQMMAFMKEQEGDAL